MSNPDDFDLRYLEVPEASSRVWREFAVLLDQAWADYWRSVCIPAEALSVETLGSAAALRRLRE